MPTTTSLEDEIRALLAAGADDAEARDVLFELLYHELRRIAHGRMHSEGRDPLLGTTALVHDVYLRLQNAGLSSVDRDAFLRLAAAVMRHVLIDGARRREARRRALERALPESNATPAARDRELLRLEDALERLQEVDAELARVVDLRFFVGLGVEEAAEALAVSTATLKRRWRVARAWLQREIRGGDDHDR